MSIFSEIKKTINKNRLKRIKKKYGLTLDDIYQYVLKYQGIENCKNNIKTLFLGSSHGAAAINTNMYDNNSAYNLCIGSQDLYYSYKLYEKYADKLPQLKDVYVFFSIFSSGYELEKTRNGRFKYYYKLLFDIDSKDEKLDISEILYLKEKSFEKYQAYKGFTGYIEGVMPFNQEVAKSDLLSHIKHAKRNNHQELYLKDFYNLAQKKGHNLYVITSPHSPKYLETMKTETGSNGEDLLKPLFDISNEINLNILNFYKDSNLSDNDFMDWEHLLPSGAIKFTKMIMEKKNGIN